jgi:hypothetical protein
MDSPKSMTIQPTLAAEVRAAARRKGWDADTFLARLIRSALDALKRMRESIEEKP